MESLVTGLKMQLATRQDRMVMVIIAILLLVVGFLSGLWAAETEKETVVVFEDVERSEGVLSDSDIQLLRNQTKQTELEQSSMDSQELSEPPNNYTVQQQTVAPISGQSSGAFIASVNGTKYYYPDCGEVSRIKEENKVWFTTEQEAIQAGYGVSACIMRTRTQ